MFKGTDASGQMRGCSQVNHIYCMQQLLFAAPSKQPNNSGEVSSGDAKRTANV